MKKLFLLLSMALVSCSCENKTEPDAGGKPAEYGIRIPLQSSITHVQPMTGIVLWNTSGSIRKEYVQLEFAYMLYNDVCKEKDVFDWTPMDRLLEAAAARGHQVVVRFRYTYPGYACAVPDYIKSWPGYEATNAKSEGRNTEFPDWRCEELQRFHMEFYRRFAERYDKDPRLAFVETGFGLWAEYHISLARPSLRTTSRRSSCPGWTSGSRIRPGSSPSMRPTGSMPHSASRRNC